jgi:hypothetical protein
VIVFIERSLLQMVEKHIQMFRAVRTVVLHCPEENKTSASLTFSIGLFSVSPIRNNGFLCIAEIDRSFHVKKDCLLCLCLKLYQKTNTLMN